MSLYIYGNCIFRVVFMKLFNHSFTVTTFEHMRYIHIYIHNLQIIHNKLTTFEKIKYDRINHLTYNENSNLIHLV